jgi:hypothetical protein
LSVEKTKEQQNLSAKIEMKKNLRERKLQKLDKKKGLLKFKRQISKHGLLKTIKSKMKNFLKKAQQLDPSKSNCKVVSLIGLDMGHDLADFKDFLEEFLISGQLKIAANTFLINYLKQDDRNLDILINFITHPFSYSVPIFPLQFPPYNFPLTNFPLF